MSPPHERGRVTEARGRVCQRRDYAGCYVRVLCGGKKKKKKNRIRGLPVPRLCSMYVLDYCKSTMNIAQTFRMHSLPA
jgi:hypothetical protein